jgi:UDP-2,4-diacetamido-2,4,6-trideoxy-beta-L-altropyranose hydrolase
MELLLRADASERIGAGHALRCLALAQAWLRGGDGASLLAAELPRALAERYRRAGLEVRALGAAAGSEEDARETVRTARACGAHWVVADGYAFGPAWQARVRASGLRLASIDDDASLAPYESDCVLNPNAGACAEQYRARAPHTRLCLGDRYALLRSEFYPWRSWQRRTPRRAQRVLLTMGGADPLNHSGAALQALERASERARASLEIKLVAGPANPHLELLRARCRATGRELCVDPPDVPALMAWAEVALSAAGGTTWELCFMGVPSVLVPLAAQQLPVAQQLGAASVARVVSGSGPRDLELAAELVLELCAEPEERTRMSAAGRALVDGLGAERASAVLREAA